VSAKAIQYFFNSSFYSIKALEDWIEASAALPQLLASPLLLIWSKGFFLMAFL